MANPNPIPDPAVGGSRRLRKVSEGCGRFRKALAGVGGSGNSAGAWRVSGSSVGSKGFWRFWRFWEVLEVLGGS